MTDIENVIIVGSGPAGYTAALYTARANLSPLVIEGFLWGGLLQQTTDVENYPGFPNGIMGPELMQSFRDQAERFGARFITDQATRVELSDEPGGIHSVWVGDEEHRARTVVLVDGRRAPQARHPRRGGARRPRRVLLRHVRRRVLQRQADDHRRRRRLGDGGGHLPLEVRLQGRDRPSPRRVPRVEDHARPRPRGREHRVADAVRGRGVPRRAPRPRWRRRGCATSKRARPASWRSAGAFIAIGHVPNSELVDGQIDLDENGYVVTHGKSTLTNRPGVFAAGDLVDHTYRQAITAAGTGCQAALDAEWYLRDTPQVPTPEPLQGVMSIPEAQWAPAADTED